MSTPTSLEDIATSVGAIKRTLYHHVGDKQIILSACYARTYRIFTFIREQAKSPATSANDGLSATLHATALAYQRDDIQALRAYTAVSTRTRSLLSW